MMLGDSIFDLDLRRHGMEATLKVSSRQGDVKVVHVE
jgi:hypothetical protein